MSVYGACRVECRDLLRHFGDCLLDADKIRPDQDSKIGQANGRLASLEELSVKFVLQLLDCAGEGRLCHSAALGRPGETAFFTERKKITNLMNFHSVRP
jgi:hypothetical protein